jgi:hypothetical protein
MYFILLLQVIFINLIVCIHSSNYIFITFNINNVKIDFVF